MEAQTSVAEWKPRLIGFFERSSRAQGILEFLENPHKEIGAEWAEQGLHSNNLPGDMAQYDLELDIAVCTDRLIQDTLEWLNGPRNEQRRARVILMWYNLEALTSIRKITRMRRAVRTRLQEASESAPEITDKHLSREIPALQKLLKESQRTVETTV